MLGHDFGFGLLQDRSPLACRQFWVVAAERKNGGPFIVHADEKLTAFLQLEGAILCLQVAQKIAHGWPQCDAHGLIMKLEIRSTGE